MASGSRRSSSPKERNRSRDSRRDSHRDEKRRNRDRSRDRSRERDRDRHRRRDRSRDRSRERDRYERRGRRNYRFDSPPKLDAKTQFGLANYASIHAIGAESAGLDPLATRPYREIYIGNIPPMGDISVLLDILNQALIAVNGTSMPGNPCLKGWISSDGHYAFIEMRTMVEASNCMQLTGLNVMGHNIKVNRPRTYDAEMMSKAPSPTVPTLDPGLLGTGLQGLKSAREQIVAASDVLAAEKARVPTDRLCIVNIRGDKGEAEVMELLESMGEVKYTHFMTSGLASKNPAPADPESVEKTCLFEFVSIENQKKAMEEIPKRGYKLILALDAVTQGIIAPQYIRKQLQSCHIMRPQIPTRALLLANLVSKEELDDDAEYVDIIDDVKTECEDYGVVLRVELPRVPKGLSEEEMATVDLTSVGSAFVLFSTIDASSKARKVLDGRKFGNRTVKAHFFSELFFLTGRFANPAPNFDKQHSSVYNPQIISDPNSAADILYKLEHPEEHTNGTSDLNGTGNSNGVEGSNADKGSGGESLAATDC